MLDSLSQANLDANAKRANLASLMKMDRVYPINLSYKISNNRSEMRGKGSLSSTRAMPEDKRGVPGSQTIVGSSVVRELSKNNLQ